MRRRLLLILFIFIAVATTALFYANQAYFPGKLKEWLVKKAQEKFENPVEIESVHYNPITGFHIRGITIHSKVPQDPPLLTVKQVSLNILYLPFSKDRKIVIPSIDIRQAHLHIVRQGPKKWNIAEIFGPQKKGSPPLSFFIRKLSITHSKVDFTDEVLSPAFSQTIDNIHLHASLSFRRNVKFSFRVGQRKSSSLYLSGQGNFYLADNKLTSQIHCEHVDLAHYLSLYFPSKKYTIKKGLLESADMIFSYKDGKFTINSRSKTKELKLLIGVDKEFNGNPAIGLNLEYDQKSKSKFKYDGYVDLNNGTIDGLPYVEQINNLRGRLYIKPDEIKSDSIKGVSLNTPFELSGILVDFDDPTIKTHLVCALELAKLRTFFPDIFEKEKIETTGYADIDLDYKIQLERFKDRKLNFKAVVDNATLSTLQIPTPLTKISGEIKYDQGNISWEDLSFEIYKTKITTSAFLENLEKPLLKLKANGKVNLENLNLVFPEIFKKEEIRTTGSADIALSYRGRIDPFKRKLISLDAVIDNASIQAAKLPEKISALSANIEYINDSLVWRNLKTDFKNRTYTLNGSINNFNRPVLQTKCYSDDLSFETKVKILHGVYKIISMKGRAFNSDFDIEGLVSLEEKKTPHLDLEGILDLDLQDLSLFFPHRKSLFSKLKPKGIFSLMGSLKGYKNDWRYRQFSLKGESSRISLGGYTLNNVSADVVQSGGVIHQINMLSDAYQGKIRVNASANLKDEQIPSTIETKIEKINLAELKKDTIWKEKKVSGFLSGEFLIEGYLSDINAMEGSGSVLIQDGHIWQLDLLENFARFLLIPEYGNIIFKEAAGNFTIQNGRVLTDDFELKSEPLNLICRGWGDFTGKLNFYIFSLFSKKTIEASDSLKKTITAILTHTNDYLTIRLTGTLKKPHYVVIPKSVDLLEKTKDFILDSLQSIFE